MADDGGRTTEGTEGKEDGRRLGGLAVRPTHYPLLDARDLADWPGIDPETEFRMQETGDGSGGERSGHQTS